MCFIRIMQNKVLHASPVQFSTIFLPASVRQSRLTLCQQASSYASCGDHFALFSAFMLCYALLYSTVKNNFVIFLQAMPYYAMLWMHPEGSTILWKSWLVKLCNIMGKV